MGLRGIACLLRLVVLDASRSVSPFNVDDCSGSAVGSARVVLTAEKLLRQSELQLVADCRRRYAVQAPTKSVAAMMRATLDCCRGPPASSSWTVGIPRHHPHHQLTTPPATSLQVPAVAAAAGLLAQLSSQLSVAQQQPLSSAFSPPAHNLLRF